MIGILFWNTYITEKTSVDQQRVSRIEDTIVDMVIENNCEIIVLAEYNTSTSSLCNKLSLKNKDFSERKAISSNVRVKILANNRLISEIIRDSKYYVVYSISSANYHFLIGGVHLPSKLYNGGANTQTIGRQLIEDIKDAERAVGHQKVVMVGDFNANPFESVMVDFDHIHSISDSAIVERLRSRVIGRVENQFFYNPMWNLLGDYCSPKGSYYSSDGGPYKLFWNTFDQVVMSADFIKSFVKESLKVIVMTNNQRLLDQSEKPDKENYSDHLPIFFSLREDFL